MNFAVKLAYYNKNECFKEFRKKKPLRSFINYLVAYPIIS